MTEAARRPRLYATVRRLARWLLAMEYRRVEVAGAERIPATGAVILVANHQNSLVDSLAVLWASPRAAGPLAKAPLFKIALLKPFLEAVGAVPVFRPQDAEENEGRGARANLATFAECSKRLKAGASIVLFPEGVSQPAPKLMPLRTGAARIALDAGVPVAIVPVGLVYEPPGERRGALLVRVGEPFAVNGPEEGQSRRSAIAATTRRMEAAMRALLAEAESQGDLAAMRVLTAVLEQERNAPPADTLEARHARIRRMAHGFAALRRLDLPELEAIRADADAFARHLSLVGVPLDLLESSYGTGRVLSFVARTTLRLAIGVPLSILASVVTWPARALGEILVARRSRVTEDVLSFNRIIGQAAVLAMEAVVAAALLGILVAWWTGVLALVAIPLLFALHVVQRDWRADVKRRIRTFFLIAGGKLRDDLRRQRKALAERLERARARIEAAGIDLDVPPALDQ